MFWFWLICLIGNVSGLATAKSTGWLIWHVLGTVGSIAMMGNSLEKKSSDADA